MYKNICDNYYIERERIHKVNKVVMFKHKYYDFKSAHLNSRRFSPHPVIYSWFLYVYYSIDIKWVVYPVLLAHALRYIQY